MFEITGNDIANLGDADLRELVACLARAELRAKGCPISAVTAGGNQDAPDGGIDVRVECPAELVNPVFVPRRMTGFQVKKPDMPPSKIIKEMRLGGALRSVIRDLADQSGAYVIVSAASIADKPLAARKKAMRDALDNLDTANQLETQFYGPESLAAWVNEYPGVVTWVREKAGRSIPGWSSIHNIDGGQSKPKPYLVDQKACLIDGTSGKSLSIPEGIDQLRDTLRTPRGCIRLVGLSGLGKTRLVQALFEEAEGLGENFLDPALAVYTDYSEKPMPTARDMARDLVARSQRAILIVDNCNPSTHSDLARICIQDASTVSLISVEYDVGDDESEATDFYRLQGVSLELVTKWMHEKFPHITQVDRERISEFSEGNFRIAAALARTLRKGETLGSLRDQDLFERLFHQRHEHDPQLLRAAEDLSLLYSVDGVDTSPEGELVQIGHLSGMPAKALFDALTKMSRRHIVQSRGRYRAILPQAIANRLAALALERIPPTDFLQFCKALTPRMLRSVSRRLGFLNDSPVAQAAVGHWLRTDGPAGDLFAKGGEGFHLLTNIAPVAPEAVLARIEEVMLEANAAEILPAHAPNRHQWIHLIKALSYEAGLFDRCVNLLAHFLAAEPPKNNHNSASDAFGHSFHLYLSGNMAPPEQRRETIRRFAHSADPAMKRCASIALTALLEARHFSMTGGMDFGAKSRSWGWQPEDQKTEEDWFVEAIRLAVELDSQLEDARSILGRKVWGLWNIPACHAVIEQAASVLSARKPWIEGWKGVRDALNFRSRKLSDEKRGKLRQMMNFLKPQGLLLKARLTIIHDARGGWRADDGSEAEDPTAFGEKANQSAQESGRELAKDAAVRAEFLGELFAAPQAMRAYQCGEGLAEACTEARNTWLELVKAFKAAGQTANPSTLGGFLFQMQKRDPGFVSSVLEAAMEDTALAATLPWLQAQAGLDEEGLARLRRAISANLIGSPSFACLAHSRDINLSPPESLSTLLKDISNLPEGMEVALDILDMHFDLDRNDIRRHNQKLINIGRDLLAGLDFQKVESDRDYSIRNIIEVCLCGDDQDTREIAKKVCASLCSQSRQSYNRLDEMNYFLQALLDTHPLIVLDTFLLTGSRQSPFFTRIPLEGVDAVSLRQWADVYPSKRYPLLGRQLEMFGTKSEEDGSNLSPLFLSLLELAPDKKRFLGDYRDRIYPSVMIGSPIGILSKRKGQMLKLSETADDETQAWIQGLMPELDQWIVQARGRERQEEESFE